MAIGIDARNGYVATRGWLETSEVKAEDLASELAEQGAKTFIFTDISRDGMMQGPNVEAIVRWRESIRANGDRFRRSEQDMKICSAWRTYAASGVARRDCRQGAVYRQHRMLDEALKPIR